MLRDHSRATFPIEEVGCNLCGQDGGVPEHAEGNYRMLRCPRCGLRYASPRPTVGGLATLYAGYLPEGEADPDAWDRAMAGVFAIAANRLALPGGRRGRLLDVGCGFGAFLERMERLGWEVVGIDASARGSGWAGRRLRSGGIVRGVFPRDLPDGPPFDAIAAFYVLEHVPDPLGFLRAAHERLAPGGSLLLRVPHTAPLKRALGWVGIPNRLYDLPAHLFDYSPVVLRRLLERAGFGEVELFVGGATRFGGLRRRTFSAVCGAAGEGLFRASRGRWILPGLSYSALARRAPR